MSIPAGRSGTGGRVRRAWRAVTSGDVDLSARLGSVELPNPVMTASGTAGHADELQAYFPLSELGAVVVKSLSVDPWPGNAAPRVHQTPAGMLNSVGLQGPGLEAWIADDLPRLAAVGARVVVSIWGQRVEDYGRAAAMLAAVSGLTAVEVNVSCPNVDDGRHHVRPPPRRPGRGPRPHRRRGQRELPQRRGPAEDVRPLGDSDGRGGGRGRRVLPRTSPVGEAQPEIGRAS